MTFIGDPGQGNSLRDEWSVDSWSAEDRYGTSCAQRLDNFDWVMPAGYPVGVLPKLEEDIEPDVCDVPNVFSIRSETAAVEPLCFPVLSCGLWAGDEPEVMVSGRELQNRMSVMRSVWYRISFRLLRLGWLRCLWPSLWSLRRDHGLARVRTRPYWWTRGGSPSLRMVLT